MTWVRRVPPKPVHRCEPPRRLRPGQDPDRLDFPWNTPAGNPGDLWRCPCGRLWQVILDQWGVLPALPRWKPATLWQRITHSTHLRRAP
jgi:hypothetical protein